MDLRIRVDGRDHQVEVRPEGAGWIVSVDGFDVPCTVTIQGPKVVVEMPDVTHDVQRDGPGLVTVDGIGSAFSILELHGVAGADGGGGGSGLVRPPMTGKLVRVDVAVGDVVESGQVLFVLEAMKMQNDVRSPMAGTVAAIHASPGEALDTDRVVVEIEAA